MFHLECQSQLYSLICGYEAFHCLLRSVISYHVGTYAIILIFFIFICLGMVWTNIKIKRREGMQITKCAFTEESAHIENATTNVVKFKVTTMFAHKYKKMLLNCTRVVVNQSPSASEFVHGHYPLKRERDRKKVYFFLCAHNE